MAELLATTLITAVFMAILVGIRAAGAHYRSGSSYDLTSRRIASSLSVCLVVVAAARAMILSDLPNPGTGQVAATHVVNVALLASVGWWLWTLRVEGVIAFTRRAGHPKMTDEATALLRSAPDRDTRTRPQPPRTKHTRSSPFIRSPNEGSNLLAGLVIGAIFLAMVLALGIVLGAYS